MNFAGQKFNEYNVNLCVDPYDCGGDYGWDGYDCANFYARYSYGCFIY